MRAAPATSAPLKVVASATARESMDDLRNVLGEMDHEERDLLTSAQHTAEASARPRRRRSRRRILALALVTVAACDHHDVAQPAARRAPWRASAARRPSCRRPRPSRRRARASSRRRANEISTTISELLATSRQIAESAQRVAQIAEETAGGARGGRPDRCSAPSESIAAIKRQVDLIVGHMLELGKKSQQIGGILEIINELAEQTNILAINATHRGGGRGRGGQALRRRRRRDPQARRPRRRLDQGDPRR